MQKSHFFKTAVLTAGACVLICWPLSAAGTGNDTPGPVSELHRLGEKIDSLEVEKQITKRNGQPIDELEEETGALRDSIKSLRLELRQGTAPLTVPAPSEKGSARVYLKKLLPGPTKGVFDRVILAAGGVTVVIGIFFLFVMLSLKARRRKQKQAAARNQTKKAAAQYEGMQPRTKREAAAAQNAYPDSFANTASESAALTALVPPLPAPEAPAEPPATQPRIPVQSQGDIQDLVLKAHGDGLDAKEISRRFHVGIDQVALILKMAKNQQR